MSDNQVELIAAALAEVDGHDIDTLESERQERYRERARAATNRLNANRGGVPVNVEAMQRRRKVMKDAFTAGVPMERALREAEPELSPGYVTQLIRNVYEWDAANGNELHGVGSWKRAGNQDIRVECKLTTADGITARARFTDLAAAAAWVQSYDGPEGGWL